MIRELTELLAEMYDRYGLTKEVIRLSEIIDELVIDEQRGKMSEETFKKSE